MFFALRRFFRKRCPHSTRQTAQSGQTGNAHGGQTGDPYSRNLSRKVGTILSSYTQAINKQESKSGSLFQPKTKAKEIEGVNHLNAVFHYVHQNPFRAGLVKGIHEWSYSSFQEYYSQKFLVVDSDITNQFLDLDFSPEKFLEISKRVIPDYLVSNYIE